MSRNEDGLNSGVRELDEELCGMVTIDQQIAELNAAGWRHVRGHIWKAPVGGHFLGPHGAWKAMKRRALLAAGERGR